MRDKHYEIFCARLDEKNLQELKRRRENFKSWNLLFKDLLYANVRVRKVRRK